MNIAFCTDKNYLIAVGVCMASICESNSNAVINFYIVYSEENLEDLSPLERIANKYNKEIHISIIDKKSLSDFECSAHSYITTSAFIRLLLPEILPKSCDKVIYLDGDTVVNGSLKEMYDTPLSLEFPVAAVPEFYGTAGIFHEAMQTPASSPYYNSGVLLMDLEALREMNFSSQAQHCAKEKHFRYLDQDVLNWLLNDHIKPLSFNFNYPIYCYEQPEQEWFVDYHYMQDLRDHKEMPVVLHYLSNRKPWNTLRCTRRDLWNKYCEKTPWKGFTVNEVKDGNLLIKTSLFDDLQEVFGIDQELFALIQSPVIDLLKSAVKLKNKKKIINFASVLIFTISSFLIWVYSIKTRKR